MDPLTIIVTAVVTGAALSLKDVAGTAVKDAYTGLKTLIIRKYGNQGDTADALEKVEAKPESEGRKLTLKEELESTDAAQDQELLDAAQKLLEAAKSASSQQGKQGINITGEKNKVTQVSLQAGDNALQVGVARDVDVNKPK